MNKTITLLILLVIIIASSNELNAQTRNVTVPKGFDVIKFYKNKGVEIEYKNDKYGIEIDQNLRLKDDDCKYFGVIGKLSYFILWGKGNFLTNKCLSYLCGSQTTDIGSVDIQGANITDEGLKAFENTTKIENLTLTNMKITGEGLKYFIKNKGLKDLYLNKSKITDENLKYLENFPKLEELNLIRTPVNGTGFSNLGTLSRLKIVRLIGTNVNDEGVKALSVLKAPGYALNLSYTKITDKALLYLEKNTNIDVIFVGGTKVTEKGMENFRNKNTNTGVLIGNEEG